MSVASLRWLLLTLALALIAWDFLAFVDRADKASPPQTPFEADAVAVLTGGSQRLRVGAELAEDRALPLLVSGAHPDSSPGDIAAAAGVNPQFIDCCTTFGRRASTTAENGAEIAEWAQENRYSAIAIVTSHYHIERAMAHMRTAMPEATLTAYPTRSDNVEPKRWWRDVRSGRRMVIEWAKYRYVRLVGPR